MKGQDLNLEESLEWIRDRANAHRFLFEVWLNCLVATTVYYDLGWREYTPAIGEVNEIFDRYRARGIIK